MVDYKPLKEKDLDKDSPSPTFFRFLTNLVFNSKFVNVSEDILIAYKIGTLLDRKILKALVKRVRLELIIKVLTKGSDSNNLSK